MEARVKEIDLELSRLKEELNNVEGSPTEVYARIVGYYRSVKNWNIGKREEYKNRTPFTRLEKETEVLTEEISPVTDKPLKASATVNSSVITGYSYFYRSSCPNCPAMKTVLDLLTLEGDDINVDMERGLDLASENLVFSAPTVIFRAENGEEVFRTGHPADVIDLFKLENASA
ncbi:MAG: anaerobic ribonucleoside-triphosphate reductase [Spirochaetales bacterium]|nr:anaerobic ribonucleoside-triphosphate reductase [Spirochaetales bacterium]